MCVVFVAVCTQDFVHVDADGKIPVFGDMTGAYMFDKLDAEDKRAELSRGVIKFMGWKTENDRFIVASMLSNERGVLKCCETGLTPTLYHDQCVVCGSRFWAEDVIVYCPSHGNLHAKCAVLRLKA